MNQDKLVQLRTKQPDLADDRRQNYCLYRHFDAKGELLYIGISISHFQRLSQHRDYSSWFSRIKTVTLQFFDSKEELLGAERVAIQREHPICNIYHNKKLKVISEIENKIDESKDFSVVRTFNLVYDLMETRLALRLSKGMLSDLIRRGEIKTFRYEGKTKQFVTGWQIIDFLERQAMK